MSKLILRVTIRLYVVLAILKLVSVVKHHFWIVSTNPWTRIAMMEHSAMLSLNGYLQDECLCDNFLAIFKNIEIHQPNIQLLDSAKCTQ